MLGLMSIVFSNSKDDTNKIGISKFTFLKYKLVDELPNNDSLSSIEKSNLYNSHKQNIAFNMLISAIIPTSGHIRINKKNRIIPIIASSITIANLPLIIAQINGDADNFVLGLFVFTAFVGIPISYLSIIIDSGIQTHKYNKKLFNNIFGEKPQSFSMDILPTYKGANFTLAYKFN